MTIVVSCPPGLTWVMMEPEGKGKPRWEVPDEVLGEGLRLGLKDGDELGVSEEVGGKYTPHER